MGLVYRDGHLYTTATPEFLDDGPDQAGAAVEPHRAPAHLRGGQLQRRHRDAGVHRRGAGPSLQLLVLHDDADREFDYVAGAEKALDLAKTDGWTVASIKDDWTTVFAD